MVWLCVHVGVHVLAGGMGRVSQRQVTVRPPLVSGLCQAPAVRGLCALG